MDEIYDFTLDIIIKVALGLSFSSISFANDLELLDTYQNKSTSILDKLLQQGETVVGEINIQALRNEVPRVQWRAYDENEPIPEFVGERSSAYYLVDPKTVIVRADPRDFTPEAVDILSLHEALGALGVKDENYQTSIGLKLLSEAESFEEKQFLKSNLQFMGGTGTSLGGGGDYSALIVKLKLIHRLRQGPHYLSSLIAKSHVPIEPLYKENEQEVKVTFNDQHYLTIHFPALIWNFGADKERENLLNELHRLISLLFPIQPENKMIGSFSCLGSKGPRAIYGTDYNSKTVTFLKSRLHGRDCTISSKVVSSLDLLIEHMKRRGSE